MLPELADWLDDSWKDYKRRWGALMSVLAAGGIATAAGVLAPLVPAGILQALGVGPAWLLWSVAGLISVVAGLWLSTWAQASSVLAASRDDDASTSLATGWRRTFAFGWVISVAMLAVGGGFLLLLVPGLLLSSLLVFAPFYQLDGDDAGMGALELSYGRVRPFLGPVSWRLFVAWIAAVVPSWIPWIGWLVGPLWAPFGLVAIARLAADLKRLTPAPERPKHLATAVMALSVLLIVMLGVGMFGAVRGARSAYASFQRDGISIKPPDPAAAQALLGTLQGGGSDLDKLRAISDAFSVAPPVVSEPVVSTAPAPTPPAEPAKP